MKSALPIHLSEHLLCYIISTYSESVSPDSAKTSPSPPVTLAEPASTFSDGLSMIIILPVFILPDEAQYVFSFETLSAEVMSFDRRTDGRIVLLKEAYRASVPEHGAGH
jgi:hypothetical protein